MEDPKECNGLPIERLILGYPTEKEGDKSIILQVQETEHVEEIQRIIAFDILPREIRDQIYALAFLKNGTIYPNKERAGISEYIALLLVNRIIYAEAVQILYGWNIFQIRGVLARNGKSPEFLNRISGQRYHHTISHLQTAHTNHVCLARFHLRKLYIPSHNISVDRLKHLISLLKYFPNLEYLRVVYLGSVGIRDMEIVNILRLLRDRRPLLKNFSLWKRTSYKEAEDITWMILEKPYQNWTR